MIAGIQKSFRTCRTIERNTGSNTPFPVFIEQRNTSRILTPFPIAFGASFKLKLSRRFYAHVYRLLKFLCMRDEEKKRQSTYIYVLSCCKIPLFRGKNLRIRFRIVCFCRIIMLSSCRGRSCDNAIVLVQSQFLSAPACFCRIAVWSWVDYGPRQYHRGVLSYNRVAWVRQRNCKTEYGLWPH